jgi:environmental stress-induced protein Ves
MSALQCVQADSVAPQTWRNGGGQTRELLVWPAAGSAAAAGSNPAGGAAIASSWQLRISRADIDASGPFSAFPGVQRWFVVLSGNGVVLHMPTPDDHTLDHVLLPGHTPLHFDGALAPCCTLVDGSTQDLNLMVRGGTACLLPVEPGRAWRADFAQCGLYTACGGSWSDGQQTRVLAAHTLLWLVQGSLSPQTFTPAASGDAAHSSTWWLGFTPETTA